MVNIIKSQEIEVQGLKFKKQPDAEIYEDLKTQRTTLNAVWVYLAFIMLKLNLHKCLR